MDKDRERPTARFHSLTDMQFLAAEELVRQIESGQSAQAVLRRIEDPVVLDLVEEMTGITPVLDNRE